MKWLREWAKTIGLVFSGIALVLLARKATRISAKVEGKEQVATDLLNSGISKNLAKGKKLINDADKDKDAGVAARLKVEKHLETLGSNDETLDDIANRFNSRRLRHGSHDSS